MTDALLLAAGQVDGLVRRLVVELELLESRHAAARCARARPTPAIFSGRITFSSTRRVGGEEELLEDEPEGLVARAVEAAPAQLARVDPVEFDGARRRAGRAGRARA